MTFGVLPGTRPSRPAYPPPVPVGFVDPGGHTPVEKALRTQQAVADQYTAWRAAHSPNIDPDVLKDNAGAFQVSDAALALAPALNAVKADADAATSKVNDLISDTRVGDDVASQIAAQRWWSRAQRTLDSIKDPAKVAAAARDLVANADDKAVPVIAEELPDYLASRNVPAGWLPEVLADRVPGLSDAKANATLKARQHAILQQNHNALTHAFAKDTAAPQLIDPAMATAQPYGG
jgi:hypothetical protein